jgi:uncharacterized membrane protein YedE/YeeE
MTADWTVFTPWSALAGGIAIGLAAALVIMLGGRIAGISGILGGLLPPRSGEGAWRAAFLFGLLIAPWAYGLGGRPAVSRIGAGWPTLVLAGLLVGLGTRYAAGCTSGHGVCGLARLSGRSVVAVAVFMAAGFASVFIVRHVLGSG